MKNKIKIVISVVMIVAICMTSFGYTDYVYAVENINSTGEVVYVDGNEILVTVNQATGTIIAKSTDKADESYLEISCDGEGSAMIQDDVEGEYENYDLTIENLSYNDVDVVVENEDEDIVEEYDCVDELFEDSYEGQAAVAVVTGISVGTLLTAVLEAAACIAIGGIIYYGGKAAVQAIKKSSKKQKYYYKAYIYNKNVFIAVKNRISKNAAVKRISKGGEVYTYTSKLAKSAILATGKKCISKCCI